MGAAPPLPENLRLPKGKVKVDIHALGELAERANRIRVFGADEWDEQIGELLGDIVGALHTLADQIRELESLAAIGVGEAGS